MTRVLPSSVSFRFGRGGHEVKIMVCYPREDRRSLGSFEEIRVQTADGTQRPIAELADVDVVRGYTAINRQEQKRSITITTDVDDHGRRAAADSNRNLPASTDVDPGRHQSASGSFSRRC